MAIARLISDFPMLLPSLATKSPKAFHGFITICGTDHEFHLSTPHFPSARGVTLSMDIELKILVEKCYPLLMQIEKDSQTVVDYLKKFQKICNAEGAKYLRHSELPLPQATQLKSLLAELEAIGWSKINKVSPNFTCLTLETRDDKERTHILKVNLTSDYPEEEPTFEADLPNELKYSWNSAGGLLSVVSAWEDQICNLQEFWDVLDQLDKTALVLDPRCPGRRHTTRRILLSNHVILLLTISVDHPYSLPHCQLFGSASLTSPLNQRLTEKYQDWDVERSIVSNLEFILGLEVVKHSSIAENMTEEWNAECAVCCSLHLDDFLPDLTCDHCSKSFHIQCLFEWLRSLPNSRQSMNFIFGECPCCTQLISCKVPV